MGNEQTAAAPLLSGLNKVLATGLKELARAGQSDRACVLAAQAWSLLRHEAPAEAERLNGLLHYLTAPHKNPPRPGDPHQGTA